MSAITSTASSELRGNNMIEEDYPEVCELD